MLDIKNHNSNKLIIIFNYKNQIFRKCIDHGKYLSVIHMWLWSLGSLEVFLKKLSSEIRSCFPFSKNIVFGSLIHKYKVYIALQKKWPSKKFFCRFLQDFLPLNQVFVIYFTFFNWYLGIDTILSKLLQCFNIGFYRFWKLITSIWSKVLGNLSIYSLTQIFLKTCLSSSISLLITSLLRINTF